MASGRSPSPPRVVLSLTCEVNIIVPGEIQRSTRFTLYVLCQFTRFPDLIWGLPIGCSSSSPSFSILEASSFRYEISLFSILQGFGHLFSRIILRFLGFRPLRPTSSHSSSPSHAFHISQPLSQSLAASAKLRYHLPFYPALQSCAPRMEAAPLSHVHSKSALP
jgi:hypothetical protein